MATRLTDEFPARTKAPTAAYPDGSYMNETAPGANDGTPLDERIGDDYEGLKQGLLDKAGITPNGQPDSVTNPQQIQAIEKFIGDGDSQLASGAIWPLSSQEETKINDIVPSGTILFRFEYLGVINLYRSDVELSGEVTSIGAVGETVDVTIGGLSKTLRLEVSYQSLGKTSQGLAAVLDIRDVAPDIPHDNTNQTAALVSYFSSLDPDLDQVFTIGPNIVFDAKDVIESLPVGVMLINNYARIGNATPTYLQKYAGLLAKSAVDNDLAHAVESGHNPSYQMINHRVSGTDSAERCAASVLYAAGRISGGQPRNLAIQQWTKSGSLDVWGYQIRRLAPWVSVDDENDMYELWQTGESIVIGQYRKSASKMYISSTAGTTGATAPTHTSGTVSDGGVDWTYVANSDTTIFFLDEFGRIGLNGATSESEQVRFTQNIDDNLASYNVYVRPQGANKLSTLRMFGTDGAGAQVLLPFLAAYGTGVMQVQSSSGSIPILRFYDDRAELRATAKSSVEATDGDTTPSVANTATLTINNSLSTTITDLSDGVQDQEVQLFFANGNTTLQDGSNIRLTGSSNVTPTALSVITLRKVSAGAITSAWIEVSRSIK